MSTGHVRIRQYRDTDGEAFCEAAQESHKEVYPWLEWCHEGYTRKEADEWVSTQKKNFDEGSVYEFSIVDENDRILGGGGLNGISWHNRAANLGYWIRSSAAGRGVATAAVIEMAKFAFSKTDLIRLEIVCAVGNVASQRVAEKVGALREALQYDRLFFHGKAHDAVMFVILKSRWKPPGEE